jgi:flagellar protein FliS
MLARRDPYEAYQNVEFDARVRGANSFELVHVCYDRLIHSLSTALLAHERGDAALKSRSLTRAVTALVALQLGVDSGKAMSAPLIAFYNAARKSILACSVAFDPDQIAQIRNDFVDVRDVLIPNQV